LQAAIVGVMRGRLIQYDNVKAGQCCTISAKRLPHYTFEPVSRAGELAVFFCNGKAEPRRTAVVVCCQHRKHVVATAACLFEHAPERRCIRQAAYSWKPVIGPFARHLKSFAVLIAGVVAPRLRGKLGPALGATALQYEAAGFACHSCAESVGASPLQNAGLECAFHWPGTCDCRGRSPRLKESRQGYAGPDLVSTEQAVNSGFSGRVAFSGGAG
jgi:hypothetical protein